MTDDRLYPPAAEYLTGPLARFHRQPRVEGLEGFVWFDVPAPDGDVVSQPIHEALLKPASDASVVAVQQPGKGAD